MTDLSRSKALAFVVAVITLGLCVACRGAPASYLVELADARRLASRLLVQLNQATNASNRAVMAETDESSTALAHEAEQLTQNMETDVAALAPLLRSLGYPKEIAAFEAFRVHFADYRKLDASILGLAIENTNHKARRLSFGPGQEAASAFKASLESVVPSVSAKDRCEAERLVSKAVLAVREIQLLQAPHIVESDDTAMTGLETQMSALAATARSALAELSSLVQANARAELTAAGTALDRFDGTSAQILKLSRRNSNVVSLDLALRARPPLTAACELSLHALEEALANEGSEPTR